MLDPHFPRSIKFCLQWAEDSLNQIAGVTSNSKPLSSQRALGRLRAELAYTTFDEIFQQGLHECLDGFQRRLNHVGACIFSDFIALPESPTALSSLNQ